MRDAGSAAQYPAGTNQTMTRLRGSGGNLLADQFADGFRKAVMGYGGLGLLPPPDTLTKAR
jgi:hypothetical protein